MRIKISKGGFNISGTKNKKILTYEESHKILEGELYKLCNCHQEYFPGENVWFPCTKEYFYKNNNKRDGLQPLCKKCAKEKIYRWRENPENKERFLEACRKLNKTEKHKICVKNALIKRQNEGYLIQYQRNNKEKIRQYTLNRKLHKEHVISKEEWESCKKYFGNSCAYCGISNEEAKQQQNNYLHREHVNHDGTNDLSNCVPACKSCNSQKWEFTLEEWYNENNPVFNQERLNKIHKWLNEDFKLYIN